MGVLDGQPVSAAITNPAFINKNQNDQMPNVLGFDRISGSGPAIADIQNSVNNIYNATGVSESTTGTVYNATPNTISNGESYQNCLTALANKFDAATGHHHTGAPGDGPPISGGLIGGVPLEQFTEQGSSFAASGNSNIVTSLLAGKVPSNSSGIPGVIVSNPQNRIAIFGATYGQLNDANGNEVYGRLSASGSVFTLTYYSQVNGLETAYTFAASANIQWFYRELFQPLVSTPVYQPLGGFEISPKLVSTLSASGSSGIFGDITLAGSGGTIIGQIGQVISVFVPPSTGGVSTLSVSGSTPLMGSVILQASGGIALTQTGQNIAISTTTPGGVTLLPTQTRLTSGSGTYTTPTGATYLRVKMIGPGGGGSGSGTGSSAGAGGDGSAATSFGTSLLSAGVGGGAASGNAGSGGGGGSGGSINSPAFGTIIGGAGGTSNSQNGTTTYLAGAPGAATPFSGGGAGGIIGSAGGPGVANSGAGGGGAGVNNVSTDNTGAGGGAGQYVDAYIPSPSSTYSYVIGTGGSGGTAGTSGAIGGNGGSGYIEITEYYNNLAVSLVGSVAANLVLAGPSSGGAAQPAFRSLVLADIPARTVAKAGTAGSVSVSTAQPINFATVVFDPSSTITTGSGWKFTANNTGYYQVNLTVQLSAGAIISIYKNGSFYSDVADNESTNLISSGSDLVQLTAGDTMDVRIHSGSTTTSASTSLTHISICQVG